MFARLSTQLYIEFETLNGDEIRDLLDGKPPVRDTSDTDSGTRSSTVPKTGKGKRKPDGEPGAGGMEPQPQG